MIPACAHRAKARGAVAASGKLVICCLHSNPARPSLFGPRSAVNPARLRSPGVPRQRGQSHRGRAGLPAAIAGRRGCWRYRGGDASGLPSTPSAAGAHIESFSSAFTMASSPPAAKDSGARAAPGRIQNAVEHHGDGVARKQQAAELPSGRARRRRRTGRYARQPPGRAPARVTCRQQSRPRTRLVSTRRPWRRSSAANACRGAICLARAKIEDLRLPAGGDEDVRRHIAVHDALEMRRREAPTIWMAQIKQIVEQQRLPGDPFLQRVPSRARARGRECLQIPDIRRWCRCRVTERRCGARLAVEALQREAIPAKFSGRSGRQAAARRVSSASNTTPMPPPPILRSCDSAKRFDRPLRSISRV